MPELDVELLWWQGCPSTERALALLTGALAAAGHDATDVRMIEVLTDEQALALDFRGSPTIRIGGVDLVALAGSDDPGAGEPAALTCRLYRHRDGRISPTPDPADIAAAIEAA